MDWASKPLISIQCPLVHLLRLYQLALISIKNTYLFFRMLSQACGFGCNDGAESAVFLAIQLIRRGCDFSTWLRPRLLSTL